MRVIGTAGHVDHGKSTLIAALTGVHPDRLKEEREREMTIDLGFGWLTLPGGEEIGIVDVPGHRDFIENMLAGIGAIDAALLIVAADEGVMPQTREHLAILDLLQVKSGIIVITKIDMIGEKDWLDLIEGDIRAALKGTTLEDAPTQRVSAKTGLGLDQLLITLSEILQNTPPRLDLGRPRLPIDRVFSIAGFGTVVTGTLMDGHLNLGDEIEILPSGNKGRIRGLQTHKKKEEMSGPGSRTAINISGVGVEDIRRGEVVVTPSHYYTTRRIDTHFRLLADASAPLKHATEVKMFIGAAETVAMLRLLGTETLRPGEEGWIQLELRDPIVAVRGDRYILRRPSPSETLGGGKIVDPAPKERHKRFDANVLERLESLLQGSPADILLQASLALGAASIKDVVKRSHLVASDADKALTELLNDRLLLPLENENISPGSEVIVISSPHWEAIVSQIQNILKSYHQQYPLRRGIPKEELKSKLKLGAKIFNLFVKKMSDDSLIKDGTIWLAFPAHEVKFSTSQQTQINNLLSEFKNSPYATPSIKEVQNRLGEDIFSALIESNELVAVSSDVIFYKPDYDRMVTKVCEIIMQNGQVTVAEVRDIFNTSRKYVLALLEHLDAIGVTLRNGDVRTLKK
jgi:selenocysteine-specific elongation factor